MRVHDLFHMKWMLTAMNTKRVLHIFMNPVTQARLQYAYVVPPQLRQPELFASRRGQTALRQRLDLRAQRA
eukprot:COSAG06_NODE_10008_length_1770_cov_2.041891_4_plen_70_part_01